MKKKLITITMAAIITASISIQTALADNYEKDIDIYVDGQKIEMSDAKPFIDSNDRTQVPVSAIGEAIGAKVTWEDWRERVIIDKGINTTVLDIGSNIMFLNGRKIKMDTAAQIVNDRTYIPIRFIGEGLGYDIAVTSDVSEITLTKREDDPAFVKTTDDMPEFLSRSAFSEQYFCKTEKYDGDNDPNDVTAAFENKQQSELFVSTLYEDVSDSEIPVYDVGNNIYREKIDATYEMKFGGKTLTNLSDDIYLEFIPDKDNDEGYFVLTLHKDYYTKTAEHSNVQIARVDFSNTEHTIVKISSIYNDDIIAPFFGVDYEEGYWWDYNAFAENTKCTGVMRVVCAGRPVAEIVK